MVLSNAERQARFRKNIKARANDPGSSARAAADAAAAALWTSFKRIGEASTLDHPKFEDWRTQYVADGLVSLCYDSIDDPDLTADELAAIHTLVEIDKALKLKHFKPD